MTDGSVVQAQKIRVRIFIDFWNFSLELRRRDDTFRVDWTPIPQLLTKEAGQRVDASLSASYEGLHVYGSYDPNKPTDVKFRNWFSNWLDKQPGVHTLLLPRQKKKGYPKCPVCHHEATHCVACGADMRGTEEKGIDSNIVKDMISLAWENAYDAAVLVSADRDFVPVAEFLQTKGIKVIHGAFPPRGSELSQKCWANIDLTAIVEQFRKR
ncbi:MAG: NYN domain-containing protein [Methylobacteriaceae bacterium]|nr:NYN domain-containing protein [Methylobacteriaceae bacterium]